MPTVVRPTSLPNLERACRRMLMVSEPGDPGPTIGDTGHGCGFDTSVHGVPLLNNPRDALSGVFSAFRVSAWSVRRKVVAVLALPVILAVVFGGLRVSSELTSASDYSLNKQGASVLAPAVTYLAATERIALPPSLADRMGGDDKTSADQEYDSSLANLKQAAASANLDDTQQGFVSKITQTGEELKNGTGTGIT